MKFSVERDALHHAISATMRATATRVVQPILANFLIESDASDRIQFTATDLDLTIQSIVPAMVMSPGRTTLAAKKLSEIVSKLPSGTTVVFDMGEAGQAAKIQCGSALFELRTMPADEYPLIEALDKENYLEINLRGLVRAVNQTVYAAASYETNNVLGGVYIELGADRLEVAATDGSRLARGVEAVHLSGLSDTAGPITAIIPAKTLQEFLKLTSLNVAPQETVRLAIQDGQISFRTEKYYLLSRLLDGQYPKYQQLIPSENKLVMTANRQALMASLERTAVMASERTNLVKMMMESDAMSLVANTPELGDSRDTVPIRYDGEPLHMAFNYRYVLDALRVIESDDVRIETNGALAPTLFKAKEENGYICLVMPVQVK
jgi:DNA polymerase-3 subunit beta